MKKRRVVTVAATVLLVVSGASHTVAAVGAGGAMPLPEWAVYVGLALFCPDELKQMAKDLKGSGNK